MALEFKACPRCKGDLHTNKDVYGRYKECLQCGWMLDITYITKQEDKVFEYKKYVRSR